MGILQINIWTCEICGKVEITHDETGPYFDSNEWDYVEGKLACPECVKKAQNEN